MTGQLIWQGLSQADRAAWVGALATFLATALALFLAVRESLRTLGEKKRRARLVAAYLYVPMHGIRVASMLIVKHCQSYAAVMPGTASIQVAEDALALQTACDEIASKLALVKLSDLAALPKNHGEALASGVGELALVIESIQSSLRLFFSADQQDDPDKARFEAAHGQTNSHAIAAHSLSKIDTFINYCVKEFKVADESGLLIKDRH